MSEESGGDASTSFVRQRRDLFVISAVLLIAQLAGIAPEKLSFFGAELRIDRPQALAYAAWGLWLYWNIRYCQALSALAKPVRNAQADALRVLALRWIMKNCADEIRRQADTEVNPLIPFEPIYEYADYLPGGSGEYVVVWIATAHGLGIRPKQVGLQQRTTIPAGAVRVLSLRAWTRVMLRSTAGTEYVFPLIFAAAPALLWLLQQGCPSLLGK